MVDSALAPASARNDNAPFGLVCFRLDTRSGSIVLLPGVGGDDLELAPLGRRVGGRGAIYVLDFLQLCESITDPPTVEGLPVS
jgi:hypothetical protein